MEWTAPQLWIAFGLLGNAAFASRWLVQWYVSERAAESVMPMTFWYLSVAGALILLTYAVYRRDPVFILACLPNTLVYMRNIVLVRRKNPATGAV